MVNNEDDVNIPMSDEMKVILMHKTMSNHVEYVKRYYHSKIQLREITRMLLYNFDCTVEVHDEYVKIVFDDGVPEKALELLESFSTTVSEDNIRVAIPVHMYK